MPTTAKKLRPVKGGPGPTSACLPIDSRLSLAVVLPGRSEWAVVRRDGLDVHETSRGALSMREVEAMAAAEPDGDWRVEFTSPLHGEVYQRQEKGWWMLIERNDGWMVD